MLVCRLVILSEWHNTKLKTYPLSPNSHLASCLSASSWCLMADSLKILESWDPPGHRATTLRILPSQSHIICKSNNNGIGYYLIFTFELTYKQNEYTSVCFKSNYTNNLKMHSSYKHLCRSFLCVLHNSFEEGGAHPVHFHWECTCPQSNTRFKRQT